MAPSTPPPPSRVRFAALTIASTASVVMSPIQMSRRVAPTSALSTGAGSAMAASLSRPLGLRLRLQVDRASDADIVEVLVQKAARRALAADAQHLEKIVVGRQLAARIQMRPEPIEHDAVDVDAAILARPGAAWQFALIDQAGDEIDGPIFAEQRRIER